MKALRLWTLIASIGLCVVIPWSSHAQQQIPSLATIELSGIVMNVTGGQSAGVLFRITPKSDTEFRAAGAYDGKNLFGRFNVTGRPLLGGKDFLCLQFVGNILFGGNDGSGFPEGTSATYVMSITLLSGGKAKGVYHVGKILGVDWEQYGIMDLSAKPLTK